MNEPNEIGTAAERTDPGRRGAIHLPPPSIWPLVVAGGISLLTAGVAVGPVVGVVGAALLVIGLGGWIQEMRRGH
jgi:hypothetical protein